MTRTYALAAALAWWVVTYSGVHKAGPFTLLSDCTDIAKAMHAKDALISAVCVSKIRVNRARMLGRAGRGAIPAGSLSTLGPARTGADV